jgi:SAM-dependent methyltransferase
MTAPGAIRHLPYQINPEGNRFHFYETHWKHTALKLLQQHCRSEGMSLLDYGCGRGETLEIFGRAGCRVRGTDLDPECVRLAAKFGPAEQLNLADPVGQFGRKSVDVVTCFHVLEHVENPKHTLLTLREIGRQYLLIAVPNLRFLYWLFARDIRLSMVNEGHLQSWDHWHFRNLAERHCGLELVAWGSDATVLPGLSPLVQKVFGEKAAIRLETGLFRRMFPLHCISVLGLWRIPNDR